MPETHQPTNRLIRETSPYLLQHAHNPVDWYPWGDEAFAKAKEEDKPLLLSCGYSACHWCHVIERESFEDEAIAALMNHYFVNIKVDREERPDIDQLYQQAVQAIAGQGGWPLTVFLDHERRPFFGGTYFPPTPMYGRMSFPQLLEAIHKRWVEKRELIHQAGGEMLDYLKPDSQVVPDASVLLKKDFPLRALTELYLYADHQNGGFGKMPKFPNPILLEMFLKTGTAHDHSSSIKHVLSTLKQMAKGGIYDQLGGGFHRYATDEHWLAPHFEKMLYDNAQLIQVYAMAYQISREPAFKTVVEETVNYLKREMLAPEGGFYATQDADSEGEEGKFFIWDREAIRNALGEAEADVLLNYYGVSEAGNFEGKTILNRLGAEERELSAVDQELLNRSKKKLLKIREERIKPFRDEKVVCGWNGLLIGALAYASQVFQNEAYYQLAKGGAQFSNRFLRLNDGTLARIYKDGEAKVAGFLEDYAFFARALLELYETDFDPSWLERSLELTETAIRRFSDGTGVYYVSSAAADLITRPVSGEDQAIPSGVAVHLENLLRLHAFSGRPGLREEAERTLASYSEAMEADLWSHAGLIRALDTYYQGFKEFTFITANEATPEILIKLREQFIPYRIVVWGREAGVGLSGHPAQELLKGRKAVEGKPTCYVCENFNCLAPATEWETINALLHQ